MAGPAARRSAVLLDLDETLLRSERAFQRAARDTATALSNDGRDVDAAVLEDAFVAAVDRVWQAKTTVKSRFGTDESEWIPIWDAALTAIGLRERIDPCDAATLFRANLRQGHSLYPDVVPALEALAGRFKLAIITNGGSTEQREKIEATGLAPYLDATLVSGEVGVGKPDPQIFERALSMLDVPADRTVHVGDSIEADVAGARATPCPSSIAAITGNDRRDARLSAITRHASVSGPWRWVTPARASVSLSSVTLRRAASPGSNGQGERCQSSWNLPARDAPHRVLGPSRT